MSGRLNWIGVVAAIAIVLPGCGGGGGGSSGSINSMPPTTPVVNTLTATVDGGPSAISAADGIIPNLLYVSVTICAPGSTSNCQTIDHVQVDTASVGLRIMGSLLNSTLLAALNQATTGANQPVFECDAFGDGYSWGPLTTVDIQFTSDEKASSVPIQIIEDPASVNIPAVPTDCQTAAGVNRPENTPATFGSNGLLGVSALLQDCGSTCVSGTVAGTYYACTSATSGGTCSDIPMSLAGQVQNPVALIAGPDNNGVVIQLPVVNPPGAPSVSGTLYFGVGTQSNNPLGTATIFQLDSLYGQYVDTQYAGTDLPYSVLDLGSSGYFFNSGITQCADLTGFYCPASTIAQTATIQGESAPGSPTGTQVSVMFDIGNADSLLPQSGTNSAIPDLGGTGTSGTFDWGLPFFYGRTLIVVFEGRSASGSSQAGPYMAF
jgi:Protein of unknown function (DUF3443)